MKMKKVLSCILVIALVFSLIPAAFASESDEEPEVFYSGDYAYTVSNGKACITWWYGDDYTLTIPQEIDGHEVISINKSAFASSTSLESIEIPDSVTSMDTNPFSRCSNLKKVIVSPDHPTFAVIGNALFSKPDKKLVACLPTAAGDYTIPNGITSIGAYAFAFCKSLTSITIPDSVTSIGDSALYFCISLENIIIPDSVASIGAYEFAFCKSLTSITIPDSVTSIGDEAFCWCQSLESITIPDSVASIGSNPFSCCVNLRKIIVSSEHQALAVIGNALFSKADKRLVSYLITEDVEYSMPNGVESIGDSAFYSCEFLTSIIIPDSVTSIGERAFYGCTSLESITIPDSVTSIGDSAFDSCDSLSTIKVERDSYAAQWAKEHGYQYEYPDALDWLHS